MIVEIANTAEQQSQRELTIDVVDDFETFLALEKPWNRLVHETDISHPFVTHEWIRTWWECFGNGHKLHILLVRDGSRIIAIAPLAAGERRIYGIPLRGIALPYNDHFPRLDFLIAERAPMVCLAIWNYLHNLSYRWDLIELPQLAIESQTLAGMKTAAEAGHDLVGTWHSADSPYIRLTGDWDYYYGRLSSKHRSNLRNRFKRLSEHGNPTHEVISSAEDVGAALLEGLRIEAAAWKGKSGTAIQCRPELLRFYTTFAQRAAARGWLRLHFLNVKGRRIAFGYNLCFKNRLCTLKLGYDPEYATFSPYNLLFSFMLREAFAQGIAEYDFLGPLDEWKLNWATERRPHYWLFVFRRTFRARLIHYVKFQLLPKLRITVSSLRA